MNSGEPPLVSCLCVTRRRPQLLRRAIACFRAQALASRELLVVYESDDDDTRTIVSSIRDASIRALEVPVQPKQSLGSLRNLAIANSRGRFVAQWDDDDWYAPARLGTQVSALLTSGQAACVLARWILYDVERDCAYVSTRRPWEGSLVALRSAIPVYPDLARGEDTEVVGALISGRKLMAVDEPGLYVYVFHGGNTWDRMHFERNLVAHATRLDPDEEARVRANLSATAGLS